jgi:hypothetical protein
MKPLDITHIFYFGTDYDALPGPVLVGVIGKQQIHRDINPNLKRAIKSIVKENVKWRKVYVHNFDLCNTEEECYEKFRELHRDKKFTRLFLFKNKKFKFYPPGR